MKSTNLAVHVVVRETIFCIINRVWIEKIQNYICGIVAKEQFAAILI
jgi:hypothetical protein